jgi:hypothetical protein
MSKKILGIICVLWSILFGLLETHNFKNNLLPKTQSELVCDLTAILLFISGQLIYQSTKNKSNE